MTDAPEAFQKYGVISSLRSSAFCVLPALLHEERSDDITSSTINAEAIRLAREVLR